MVEREQEVSRVGLQIAFRRKSDNLQRRGYCGNGWTDDEISRCYRRRTLRNGVRRHAHGICSRRQRSRVTREHVQGGEIHELRSVELSRRAVESDRPCTVPRGLSVVFQFHQHAQLHRRGSRLVEREQEVSRVGLQIAFRRKSDNLQRRGYCGNGWTDDEISRCYRRRTLRNGVRRHAHGICSRRQRSRVTREHVQGGEIHELRSVELSRRAVESDRPCTVPRGLSVVFQFHQHAQLHRRGSRLVEREQEVSRVGLQIAFRRKSDNLQRRGYCGNGWTDDEISRCYRRRTLRNGVRRHAHGICSRRQRSRVTREHVQGGEIHELRSVELSRRAVESDRPCTVPRGLSVVFQFHQHAQLHRRGSRLVEREQEVSRVGLQIAFRRKSDNLQRRGYCGNGWTDDEISRCYRRRTLRNGVRRHAHGICSRRQRSRVTREHVQGGEIHELRGVELSRRAVEHYLTVSGPNDLRVVLKFKLNRQLNVACAGL